METQAFYGSLLYVGYLAIRRGLHEDAMDLGESERQAAARAPLSAPGNGGPQMA
jgi:hypothetical protein